jgi:transcriptional regulator with XRE-family HTH domain
MDIKKLIGLRLKELRKKRRFSQEEVAALANITAKHVSSIELGKENPTLETFLKLAAVFKVELWELLNYGHELSRKDLQAKLISIIKRSKDDELRLFLKFVNAITK